MVDVTAPNLTVRSGLELLDNTGTVIDPDISEYLLGGSVKRDGFRPVHATCRLDLSIELQWTSQRVRPYMTLGDGTTEQTWYLGQFLLATPRKPVGEVPVVFRVDGYDLMHIPGTPVGAGYTVASGTGYLAAAQSALEAAGNVTAVIDQTSAASTLSAAWSWALVEEASYRRIATDLLAAVGYRAPYADRDGAIRSEPYLSPGSRPVTIELTSGLVEELEEETDTFDIPNRWVGVNDDPTQTLPAEGAGLYTLVNQSDGPTSIDQRGYTKTAPIIRVSDVATQAALEAVVKEKAEADRAPYTHLRVRTGPLPVLWHQDVVRVNVPERGGAIRCVSTSWELDLLTGEMTHELRRHYGVV